MLWIVSVSVFLCVFIRHEDIFRDYFGISLESSLHAAVCDLTKIHSSSVCSLFKNVYGICFPISYMADFNPVLPNRILDNLT